MVIVWGSKLYGKVDVVPGFFHVATRFGHVYYLPLIPTQSFVVLGENGKQFQGVPIPMSAKSVFIAWVRAFLFVACISLSIAALVNLQDRDPTAWITCAVMAVGAGVLCGFVSWHKSTTRASLNRACALGELIGLNEAGMAEIYKIYGEAGGRGFEVSPAAAAGRSFPSPMPRPTPVVPMARAARKSPDLDPIPLEPMPEDAAPAPAPAARPARQRPTPAAPAPAAEAGGEWGIQ
jgi:hypothetical protein